LKSKMRFKKIVFPAFMLGAALYILLPTADELLIHPTLGLFLSYGLNIPYLEGVLISVILYRTLGCACMAAALITGGRPAYFKLKESLTKKKFNLFSR
jgi:hypothetical protein